MDAHQPFPTKAIVNRANRVSASLVASHQREDWAERAQHWANKLPVARKRGDQRREIRAPLVLAGHGMHLRINHGALEVRNGFTHYPQQREECRFFRGDQQRPSRIIVLEGSGAITFDVLAWLAEQDIPLVQVDYRGNAICAVGNSRPSGAQPELMRAQLLAAGDLKRSMAIATFLVREKLIRSRGVLSRLLPTSPSREVALAQLKADIARLAKPWTGELAGLLGVEGKGAAVYFKAWHGMPITWKGVGKHPIPAAWHSVGHRRSRGNVSKSARHPIQAMLNYGYAVMESQARIEAAKMGLDPMVGFLHQLRIDRLDRPGLVLDVLEPMRPDVDRSVLGLVRSERFSAADFALTSEGTCRIHPQLARRVVTLVWEAKGLPIILRRLVGMLHYQQPKRPPHRSKAWLEAHGWSK
jgi:CRISP-associated protein Cas1